ncbi:MAG: alanine racemase, partial [Actinomycetia bacterium]|nr:alanine racemase [Actinomycetes bacterium]
AHHHRITHAVVLMVELGDLREGVPSDHVVDLARTVQQRPGLRLDGLGTNLACHSGVVPDQSKMDELSSLVEQVESACGHELSVVSGGNSANLEWVMTTDDVGRIDDLRLGESILLGTEPLHRQPIDGLHTDAFTLVAEVIEARTKPASPWGDVAQTAFGDHRPRRGVGSIRHAIVALGRQDVDPDGITLPPGITALGMSSDHLVLDIGDNDISVGGEIRIRLNYSALVRVMTSPFVVKVERGSRRARPETSAMPRVGHRHPRRRGQRPEETARGLSRAKPS